MEFFIQHLIEFIFTSVCSYFVYLVKKYKKEHEEQLHKEMREKKRRDSEYSSLKDGVQAMLRDRLIQGYNYYNEKGYCPIYARESLCNVYEAYHALGGNGTGTVLYEKLQQMPTEPSTDQKVVPNNKQQQLLF